MDNMKNDEAQDQKHDELAESLNDLFTSISTMIKSELQGTNNHLELLEKMNLRVAEEYKGFGDLASGLRVFVEQLKCKSGSFNEYVEQIDAIEKQVTEFEAVVSMLDKYVALLESRVLSVYQHKTHLPN
ncbi:biogenesis of lysosome-related organelles complex 1 subunit 2 [Lotus japonicus]|uniref:biogenesis of lysosome-related organelles complex 1 subunit 2 n=1 Tax=Lotus japonicus TaxID=34305 RepID=UPI00258AD809|nr:biogenesis of lysosome-related organelles complex 1 subunit 2 [Lotus japonicus]